MLCYVCIFIYLFVCFFLFEIVCVCARLSVFGIYFHMFRPSASADGPGELVRLQSEHSHHSARTLRWPQTWLSIHDHEACATETAKSEK